MEIKKLVESLSDDEKAEIRELLKQEVKEDDELYFEPLRGEDYYCISDGEVKSRYNSSPVGNPNTKIGNCYRTQEEAEAVLALREHVIEMNKKYGRHENVNFSCSYEMDYRFEFTIDKSYKSMHKLLLTREDAIHINSTKEDRAEWVKHEKKLKEDEELKSKNDFMDHNYLYSKIHCEICNKLIARMGMKRHQTQSAKCLSLQSQATVR